jgi:D-alanyl-lipoteichoic acid acyltransferase DltB (MBOAT superfamily)
LNHRWRNRLLLVASYVFYGYWDWRFLSLMLFSTGFDYFCARRIDIMTRPAARKAFLIFSVTANLAILGFFKYFNFFQDGAVRFGNLIGWNISPVTLNIILPLGISFYTFQTMSYVIDVYRRDLKPARTLGEFALFVSFFPQLVAGPIERAGDLLPQVERPRNITWERISSGTYYILWGLFLKVVVADNLAAVVDPVFSSRGPYNGADVLVALYAFAFQIFCDFGGYSSMAKGLGRYLGFELMDNFRQPYFATNPKEFWQHWHISLSTWLRDYLYIPLGGNRGGEWKTYRNLALTMLLGGLWHGAAWTFVAWGAFHGALLIAHKFISERTALRLPGPRFLKAILFFHVTCLGWLLFRAVSLNQVGSMLHAIFFNFDAGSSSGFFFLLPQVLSAALPILIVQYFQFRSRETAAALRWAWPVRGAFYFALMFAIITMGRGGGKEFIYFQF